MAVFDYAVKVNDLTEVQAVWHHCLFFFLIEVSRWGLSSDMSSIGRFEVRHEMTPESYLDVGEVMLQPYNKTVESLIKGTWMG